MIYVIDHYALRWQDAGHRVIYHIGPENIPDADVVIVNIDLSVVPKEYVDLINKLPVVINGEILDISRRRFSQLALSRIDNYTGPVIVKTNANYGGRPDMSSLGLRRSLLTSILGALKQLLGILLSSRFKSIIKRSRVLQMYNRKWRGKSVRRWDTIETLNPLEYPIFEDIKSVPYGVWGNDNLIVERFIGNPEGRLFYTHYCAFFGDKEIAGRLASPNPNVKFGNAVSDEETPIPDEVRQWRKDIKIDYGRFDYLEAEGKYFLIDVNKTEGGGTMCYQYPAEMDFLASGLEFYIGCESRDS